MWFLSTGLLPTQQLASLHSNGSTRKRKRGPARQESQSFCNLISLVISPHFCYFLFVRSTSPGSAYTQGIEITKGHKYHETEIIRNLLRCGLLWQTHQAVLGEAASALSTIPEKKKKCPTSINSLPPGETIEDEHSIHALWYPPMGPINSEWVSSGQTLSLGSGEKWAGKHLSKWKETSGIRNKQLPILTILHLYHDVYFT